MDTAEVPLQELWGVMEDVKVNGLARSIGLCNFPASGIELLSERWTIPPSMNQVSLGDIEF